MGEVFYWLLNMTLLGSLAGLPAVLLRLIRPLPRRAAAWLWAAPFLRWCLPWGVSAPFGLLHLLDGLFVRTVPVWQSGFFPAVTVSNLIREADGYAPFAFRSPQVGAVFAVAGRVWAVGAAALVLTGAVLYGITLRAVRGGRQAANGVFLTDAVRVPAVYGVVRPRILLPAGTDMTAPATRHVLAHERAHIRHGDNLWRLLAFAVAAAHWFNPLAWVYLKLFLTDLELACDERVCARLDPDDRRDYARALLSAAAGRADLFAAAFGGAPVRLRIDRVLSFKRLGLTAGAGLALLTAALLVALLTNG